MNVHVEKTVPITFKMVVDAYQKVRKGGKAAGIDGMSWETFDKDVTKQLYVIWNRLASGSYHPQAVREVEIPKKDGKMRKLGIPTLRDRIAQCVVKDYMEQRIDHKFHQQSYGYRPLKSSKQAIEEVGKNNIEYDWVIDLDIANFFDEIDHELLMKGVETMIEESWVKMYVKRWLTMKIETKAGEQYSRGGKGTPQGGVISPLLANIFLHFALDKWIAKHYPETKFVRYADDMIIHCKTKEQAETILNAIKERLTQVKLRLSESKTKIVYCKDYRRRQVHEQVEFGFLGYSFRPRKCKSKMHTRKSYTGYTAEISQSNQKKIREAIRESINWNNTSIEMKDIANAFNSKLRGWINYFGLYSRQTLRNTLHLIEQKLLRWIQRKYKILSIRKANLKLKAIKIKFPKLFYHWGTKYC